MADKREELREGGKVRVEGRVREKEKREEEQRKKGLLKNNFTS